MMKKLKNWWRDRFSTRAAAADNPVRKTGVRAAIRPKKVAVTKVTENAPDKNSLIRNKYVREDTGTHETLKILDDSLVDSGEEPGIDPYNTGGFDRSKNWNNRFRK